MYTIYSKDGCPYCTQVRQVLYLSKQDYTVLKLGTDYTKEEFYGKFGKGSTFPQVILTVEGLDDDTHLGGCTETVKYLQENKII